MTTSKQTPVTETAPAADNTASLDEQLKVYLEAVSANDAETIATYFYLIAGVHGPAGTAALVAALQRSSLTATMLAALSQRAEAAHTQIAWAQLAEAATVVSDNNLAVSAARSALKIDPTMQSAALIFSVAANRLGQFDEATRVIAEIDAQVPGAKNDPQLILQATVAELGLGQPAAALKTIDAQLPKLRETAFEFDAIALRARALSGIPERAADAVSAWEAVLARAKQPLDIDNARNALITALFQDKQYEKSLQQLDLAIEESTDEQQRSALIEMRPTFLMSKGDVDGALGALDDQLAKVTDPNPRAEYRLQQARMAVKAMRWKDAAGFFDAAKAEAANSGDQAKQRPEDIQLEKVLAIVSTDFDLVSKDLDEAIATWDLPVWPTPIDLGINSLLAAGRSPEALAWLEKHLAQTPALADHLAAYQLLGSLKLQAGDYEGLQEYRQAIKIDPEETDPRAWSASLVSAAELQEWQLALSSFEHLTQLQPTAAANPSIRVFAAQSYLRVGNADTALKLTENLEQLPLQFSGMRDLTRAEALIKLGQIPEGLATINAALKSSESTPDMAVFVPSLQLLRSQALNQQDKFEAARDAATVAIQSSRQTAHPYAGAMTLLRLGAFMQRSLALYRLGKLTEAHADINSAMADLMDLSATPIRKLVDNVPEYGGLEGALWYAKGAVLEAESRSEEALAAYTRAEKLETQGAAAAIARGFALYSTGAFTEATWIFDTAVSRAVLPRERAAAFAGKGRALVRLGQYEKAIATLQSALDARLTEPDDDPVVFEQLGLAYSSLKRNGAANRAFRRAWALTDPDKQRTSANLARGVTAAELQLNNPDAALKFLDGLPETLADERTLLFNRALALDALGKRREAISWLVRAREAGLDHAQLELNRLDAPAGLARWTHYWFGAQARPTRRAFGIALLIIATTGLAAPLFQFWIHRKLDWYLLLLPSVVALILLALPNMTSISFDAAGFKLTAEPLPATGRDSAAIAAPESFVVPAVASVTIPTT